MKEERGFLRMEDGSIRFHTRIGGYPLVYSTDKDGAICRECIESGEDLPDESEIYHGVHWEGTLCCGDCGDFIPSAYGPNTIEIEYLGPHHAEYFLGDSRVLGIGDTPEEAKRDAIERLYEIEADLPWGLQEEWVRKPTEEEQGTRAKHGEFYHYVAVEVE